MRADAAIEAAVIHCVATFGTAYNRRDPATILALFAPDADVVFLGTGADERRVGPDAVRAQLERDFAQSDEASFAWSWQTVSQAGMVAWITAEGHVSATIEGHHLSFPLRLTGVLERRATDWLFVQMHLSVPATSEPEGHSFPTLPW